METKTLAALALEIAMSQLGQREMPKGSNCGPMVNKYLAAVGLKPGYAWCQAFVNYCYEVAAKKLGIPEPVINTAGVLDCWNRTSVSKKVMLVEAMRRHELVEPGMQFILKLGDTSGHTGLVVNAMPPTNKGAVLFETIEGNTDDAGGREGYKVARRLRSFDGKGLLGFIKY
jgi:hypothetical protein